MNVQSRASGRGSRRRPGRHRGHDGQQHHRAKIRGRQGSSAPADAAGKLLGVRRAGEKESKRFGTLVHLAYGTGWGAKELAIDGWHCRIVRGASASTAPFHIARSM